MIRIDDKFLEEVGLAEMPEEQKQAFMKEKDFMRMTEQDGDVWKKVLEMMSSEE